MSKLRKIIYIMLVIIMLPILIISGVILINSYINPEKVPSFFGWKPFIVLSGSMETEIYAGDIAVVKETDLTEIKEGDIIAFREEDMVITHRIIEITTDEAGNTVIYTKGDNNDSRDQNTVSLDQIEGVYQFRISGLGNVAMFIQTPTGIIACLSIPIAILIIMQIANSVNDKKYEKEEEKKNKDMQQELNRLRKENEELSKK